MTQLGGAIDLGVFEEGLAAVLAHEMGLLSAFIGEDFVMPLVQAAWETTLIGRATERPSPRP